MSAGGNVARRRDARPSDATRDTLWGGRLHLWQPGRGTGYRFNLDPVLLSGFVTPATHVLDLGAGCGVLGLLLLAAGKAERVTAVEAQPRLAELAVRSAVDNGLADRFKLVHGDLREVMLPRADTVVFNPPYFRAGAGRAAPNDGRDAARHERLGGLADFVRKAREALAPYGRLAAIVPRERADELQALCAGVGLTIHRRRWAQPREGAPPNHLMLEAMMPRSVEGSTGEVPTAASPQPRDEPPLIVHRGAGRAFAPEVEALLAGPHAEA